MELTITDALTAYHPSIVAKAWGLPLAEVESVNTELQYLFDDDSITNDAMLALTDIIDERYDLRNIEIE